MKKTLFTFLLFIISTVVSAESFLRLDFSRDTVSIGELVSARVVLDTKSLQEFQVPSLKGRTLANMLYVQAVSAPIKKSGEDTFFADADVVFLKVPESNQIETEVDGRKLRIHWNNLRINNVETPQDYVLGDFVIPSPRKILLWLFGGLFFVLIAWGALTFKKRHDQKKRIRSERLRLKRVILDCKSYDDVVKLWQMKKILITEFPHIEEPFKKLESVLFKYQFKPTQSLFEQGQVVEAYKGFVRDTEGGFRGI